MKNIFIFLIFISQTGFAEEPSDSWTIEIKHKKPDLDELYVIQQSAKNKKPILIFKTRGYISAQEVYLEKYKTKYLITRWTHGAHGETLRIFDPYLRRPLLYTLITSWPVLIEATDDKIKLTVPDEKFTGDPTPGDKVIYWSPKESR